MSMNNNNVERKSTIQGVGENSYMHKCYLGSLAKVTGYDICEFLQGFIKGLHGEVGIYIAKILKHMKYKECWQYLIKQIVKIDNKQIQMV